MTKRGAILFFVGGLLGAGISFFVSTIDHEFNKAKSFDTGVVVKSVTDIKKGDMISPNMVVAKSMATTEIPTLAYHPAVVIGAHADRDILKGEIIGANDIVPYDRLTEVSVFALKDISGGVPIRIEDVTSTPATGTCRAVDKHGRCTNVVGRWTKKQILKGQQILDQDLFPE